MFTIPGQARTAAKLRKANPTLTEEDSLLAALQIGGLCNAQGESKIVLHKKIFWLGRDLILEAARPKGAAGG